MMEGKNRLLQSLLQVAVGLHHFRNQNVNGAIKLFNQALSKKDEQWSGTLSINTEKLYQEVKDYIEKLNQYLTHPFSYYDLSIEINDPTLLQLVNNCVPQGVAEEDKY